MKILVAPNSFKNCLTASEVIRHFSRGLMVAMPSVEIVAAPMADGGDGTAAAMLAALGGSTRRMKTVDALNRPIHARYGECPGGVFVIEMAAASGLARLGKRELDPLRASTFGTGVMIRRLVERGARSILVGAGGSATVDGGAGALQALDARMLDKRGRDISVPLGGGALGEVTRVDTEPSLSLCRDCRIEVLVDVDNPLLGASGAARVFAPQKGASARDTQRLERNLKHWAGVLKRAARRDFSKSIGAGAAGGLAFGLASGAGATLKPGAETIARAASLEKLIRQSDVVVTGEGEVNGQTIRGKAPAEVLRLAGQHGKPCLIVCGRVGDGAEALLKKFPTAILWPIADGSRSLEDSLRAAPKLLRQAGFRAGRTLTLLTNATHRFKVTSTTIGK